MCFKSKNLYNYTNYIIRQEFINNKKIISAMDLNKSLKTEEVFQQLTSKTSQLIILQLSNNWKSFFKSIKKWKLNNSSYCGMPKLPKYKEKNGRNIVLFDYMQGSFKDNKYYFANKLVDKKIVYNEYIDTNIKKDKFVICRIIPYGSCYKIEMVYKIEIEDKNKFNNNYLAIDLGINNLATLTNNIGLQPIVINGKILKSINNYYNKLMAQAMSYVGNKTSKRIQRIGLKRNNIINTHTHKISRWIINYCLENNIENIVIGRNKDWQRNSNIGNKNNQNFTQIPFERLIDKIKYKGLENGIKVSIIEEQYTSKSSFIDNDIIPTKFGDYNFSGNRVKRGLYKSKDGKLINADVNGSYNILRKGNTEFKYNDSIKGISLYPVKINIS